MVDRTPELEARLAERSRKETLREGVGREPPRGMPETLWVLFSYGWQPVEAQHRAQLDLYERVKHILNENKPPDFAWLPKIELWRDEERLENAHGAKAQIEVACDRAFLALVMMSRKYPVSPGCMMEFERFVDVKGENLPGKAAIVVAVNCKRDEADRRFSDGLRLWIDDEGRTLVQGIRRGEAAKDAFAKRIATQIWLAATRYLGGEGAGRPNGAGMVAAIEKVGVGGPDLVEDYISRRGAPMLLDKFVTPRARTGARGAKIFVPEASLGGEGEGADILKHLTDWTERRDGPRMTALLGDFGMGKTVTCQMLTQRLLERRKADRRRTPLPIYVDLREIRDAKAAGAADLELLMADMLRRVGEAPLDPRQVIRYARETGALVIFDGLDEVTNKLSRGEAEALYRTILRIVPAEDWAADREARRTSAASAVIATPSEARGMQSTLRAANGAGSLRSARDDGRAQSKPRKGPLLLVSCRTHYFPDIATQRAFLVDKDRAGLDASADVEIWFMLPFNKQQVESYLRQNLGGADGARALEMIGETYNLEELSTRPILLRFFSETFRELEEEKLKGATIDIGKLYEKFVDQTLARDGLKHVIPLLEKKLLLGELALHFHIEGLNDIANNDLDEWLTREIEAERALSKLKWGAAGDAALTRFELFLQDLRNATLLVRPGEKDFRFGHTSVREFFLAEALHRHIREGRLEALGGQTVTDETIDFLIARQRNGASEPDARRFREQFPRLLDPGRDKELRWFAAKLVWRAGEDLLWPEIADFSDFDLTNFVFAAPGLDEAGAREIPPRGIWRSARLHGAMFFGLALSGQDFLGADASSSFWIDCDFFGATTEGLDLSAAELRRCRALAPFEASTKTIFAVGVGCRQGLASPLEECDTLCDRNAPPQGPIVSLILDGAVALASGSADSTIRLWDPRTGKTLRVLKGHEGILASLAALEIDGSLALASGSCPPVEPANRQDLARPRRAYELGREPRRARNRRQPRPRLRLIRQHHPPVEPANRQGLARPRRA